MGEQPKKLSFSVVSRRLDAHGSMAHCKSADIMLDTDLAGRKHRCAGHAAYRRFAAEGFPVKVQLESLLTCPACIAAN